MTYTEYKNSLLNGFYAERRKYTAAYNGLEEARKAVVDAERAFSIRRSPENQKAMYKAKDRLVDAEAAVAEAKSSFHAFDDTVPRLDRECRQCMEADARVNPGEVDPAGVTLLNSGVLTASDISGMVQHYGGNTTMLRLIGKKAGEMAAAIDVRNGGSGKDRVDLLNASLACQSTNMREWSQMVECVKRLSPEGQRQCHGAFGRSESLIVGMMGKFEEIARLPAEVSEE